MKLKIWLKNMEIKNLNTKFLKAKYGDASGVRGSKNKLLMI